MEEQEEVVEWRGDDRVVEMLVMFLVEGWEIK